MSWFPLAKDMMESESFRALTPTDKLYMWLLISEYNLRGGQFYKSDLEVAETLKTSEKTVRRARKKLSDLGWIGYRPGRKNRTGQGLATQYLDIRWALPPQDGRQFARMHRYAYEAMLNYVRRGVFDHADVVVYVYLDYWRQMKGGESEFFISKRDLRQLTNIQDAAEHVTRLHDLFQFNGGARLFQYSGYQRLSIQKWATFADPEEDETNRKNADLYRQEIKRCVSLKKLARKKSEILKHVRSSVDGRGPDGLPVAFMALAGCFYSSVGMQRPAAGPSPHEEALVASGRAYGCDKVLEAMVEWFLSQQTPKPQAEYPTLLREFLSWFKSLTNKASAAQGNRVLSQ